MILFSENLTWIFLVDGEWVLLCPCGDCRFLLRSVVTHLRFVPSESHREFALHKMKNWMSYQK